MSEQPSKIIVDDDWKSQVEKEKRMAAKDVAPPPTTEPVSESMTQPMTDSMTQGNDGGDDYANFAPPDASFETLMSMLFTQGMGALGQLPGEHGGTMPINKPFAKHFIDTIEMLGEKTKGNLSEDETKMHGEVLHALRMMFVQTKAAK